MTYERIDADLHHLRSWSHSHLTDHHGAKDAFIKAMKDRVYTDEMLVLAWGAFIEGWKAHDDTVY